MKHFTQKIITFVGAVSTALAAFAGDGTPASPFTTAEIVNQLDELAKSEKEVFVQSDFIGFGTSVANATQQHVSGELFLVGTAQQQLIVRGTNYAAALEWADSKHNLVMRGHVAHENEQYIFVAEELNGAYTAVIGQAGIGAFAAKANFTIRQPELLLTAPRVLNKEREVRSSVFRADTTIAGTTNGYSQFLLVGKPGNYPVTLLSAASNIRITNTLLQSGNTAPTKKNRTYYRFVAEADRVGFVLSEDGGKTLKLDKPTEIYIEPNAMQLAILKEKLNLSDTNFIPMTEQTLTSLRSLLRTATANTNDVFDLNGRKVGTADELSQLPKGIYVVGGRKVLLP